VWLRHELRQTNPLIDVRLLRNRQIAMVNLTLFVSMLGPSLYPQILLPMIQQPVWTGIGLGVTATLAGILKLPTNLTSGTAAIAAGFVARRFGMRGVVVVSTFVVLSAWLMLIVEHQALWFVMVMMVILLAPSLTILYGCAPALIIEASPRDRTSEATGLTQVLRAIGMSIGTQVIALGLASSFVTDASGTRFPGPQAYLTVFWIFAGLSLIMVLCSLAIPRRRAPATEERQAAISEAA